MPPRKSSAKNVSKKSTESNSNSKRTLRTFKNPKNAPMPNGKGGDSNGGGVAESSVEKKRTSKYRLYSSHERAMKAKKEKAIREGKIEKPENDEDARRSAIVEKRRKIKFFQTSSELPLSAKTLQRQMKQIFEIMKDIGYFDLDREVDNPLKKTKPIRTPKRYVSKDGKVRIVQPPTAPGEPVLSKYSISSNALEIVRNAQAYYIGEILQTAQEITQNNHKLTVTPVTLDLAYKLTKKYMGPQWNMKLEPRQTTQ